MKMKRVKYIYVAMLLLGTTSCADMLDRFPLDSLAPETYYNNEMELKSATNNFYGMFPGASSGYGESDDIVCVFTLPEAIIGSRTIPTTGGGWDWGYLSNISIGQYPFLNRYGIQIISVLSPHSRFVFHIMNDDISFQSVCEAEFIS